MPPKTDFYEDKCLADRCLADDPAAWQELECYRPDLERDARRFRGWRVRTATAEDIVQDVWLHLLDHGHSPLRAYDSQLAPLRIYLRRLVRLRVRTLRIRANRRPEEVALAAGHDHADPGASGGITEAEFHECVDHLGPVEQHVLADELRERRPGEKRPPLSAAQRKAKQRLKAMISAALGQD